MSEFRLADLMAALSHVTDLGMGQPQGNAVRVCLLARRLAEQMRVSDEVARDIYYTAMLQHVGCTAYALETAALFGGDDIAVRADGARVDFSRQREALSFLLFGIARNAPPYPRIKAVATAIRTGSAFDHALKASNCEVAFATARRLQTGTGVEQALLHMYERWDGLGNPFHVAGDEISLPARVTQAASQAVLFHRLGGWGLAADAIERRAGTMLDPAIAAALLQHGSALLEEIDAADPMIAVLEAEPSPWRQITAADLEQVARAFGDVVDLKSPFTHGHSTGVAMLAEAAAIRLNLNSAEGRHVFLAGLLHDLGRVAVANGIWDKPASLTSQEWDQVRLHPYYSERILCRSPLLAPVGALAGLHHERLDGSGYYRQLPAAMIPIAARILAAADMYQAMTQERPYRPAHTPEQAAAQLERDAHEGRLDPEAVSAVLDAAGHPARRLQRTQAAGLTGREVEVLRLAARGRSVREIGRLLSISPKTADHHIQHIYTKIGVSTRAGAAIFAMEHDLIPIDQPGEIG